MEMLILPINEQHEAQLSDFSTSLSRMHDATHPKFVMTASRHPLNKDRVHANDMYGNILINF